MVQLFSWLTATVAVLSVSTVTAVDPLVDVSYTKYLGSAFESGVTQWLGIRFAAPPLGELRFQAPQDPIANSSVQIADQHGLLCLGTKQNPTSNTTSEDCLFMEIYAPSNATVDSKLPVMVFFQGGGFNSDSDPNFNGTGLVVASEHNIIVVTFNYRVGPYGFLASQEILEGGSTNNGLKDQRKALWWVQDHITEFGGDPGHVVITGASAGGASVTFHLTAYGGRDDGLFVGAAAESQSFATMLDVNQSQYQYDNLVIRTECVDSNDTLACLRGLTAVQLQTANINTPSAGAEAAPLYMYGPTIDGDIITDLTYRLFTNGQFVHVPVIFGDDTNEGTVFVPASTSNKTEMYRFLKDQFPYLTLSELREIDNLYPQTNETWPDTGAYWRKTSNAYGEMRYICPGLHCSQTYWDYGVEQSWNYHYDVLDPTLASEGYGVTHTSELNAIWGPTNVYYDDAPASYFTSNAGMVPIMQGYWTSFVRALDPNVYRYPGTPYWNVTGGSAGRRIYLNTNNTHMEVVPADQAGRCEWLSTIAISLHQ